MMLRWPRSTTINTLWFHSQVAEQIVSGPVLSSSVFWFHFYVQLVEYDTVAGVECSLELHCVKKPKQYTEIFTALEIDILKNNCDIVY